MSWINVKFFLCALLAVSACKKSNSGSAGPEGEVQPEDAQIKSDENGVVTATIVPDKTLRVGASVGSGLEGTTVVFPAGTLAVAADVSIAEGQFFEIGSIQSELAIDPAVEISQASGTILLTVSELQDPLKPIIVNTKLREGAALAPPVGKKYALISQTMRKSLGDTKVVAIDPNVTITEESGILTFAVNYFGAFAVVLVPEAFSDTKEAQSTRPLPTNKTPDDGNNDGGDDPEEPVLVVVTTTPAAGSAGSRPDRIEIVFNDDVKSASATGNLTVTSAGVAVAGSVSSDGKKLSFFPSRSFLLGSTYTVKVGTGLKSVQDASLVTPHSFEFAINAGSWTSAQTVPSIASGAETKAVSLNHGNFGYVARDSALTKLSVFAFGKDGWSTGPEQIIPDVLTAYEAAGSADGRMYVSYLFESDSNAFALRYFPAFSAPYNVITGGTSNADFYTKVRVVGAGSAGGLYLAMKNDYSIVSRRIAGDTWGDLEVVVPSDAAAPEDWKVSANSVGTVAMTYYRVPQEIGQVFVYRRDSTGTWTSLTPTGSEVTSLIDGYLDVGIADSGKVTAFWCESSSCYASDYSGATWTPKVELNGAMVGSNYSFAFDPVTGTAARSWTFNDNGTKKLLAATFKNGVWSAVAEVDSGDSSLTPSRIGADAAGRMTMIWMKSGNLRASRHSGNGWSQALDIHSNGTYTHTGFAVDPSGEALVTWTDGSTPLNYVRFR